MKNQNQKKIFHCNNDNINNHLNNNYLNKNKNKFIQDLIENKV